MALGFLAAMRVKGSHCVRILFNPFGAKMVAMRIQRRYTIDEKLEVLDWLDESTKVVVARESGIPYDTIRT